MLKVEPQVFVPTSLATSTPRYPWKTNIVTTVFWIGEQPTENNPVPNNKSSWDANWTSNYGGYDTPGCLVAPQLHPGLVRPAPESILLSRCRTTTLPTASSNRKPRWLFPGSSNPIPSRANLSARIAGSRSAKATASAMRNGKIAGPFRTDHFQYVFQNERPKPNLNRGAGLDVSPAVRDYLGLPPTDVTDWQFVEVRDVPPGPWRNYGDNNHFVIAKRQAEQQRVVQETTDKKKK